MEGLAHNGFTMPIEETTARRLAALTLLLASLIYLPAAAGEPASNTITVVYNHVRTDSATDLQRGGGFGAFVEFNGRVILFDTGGQADILLHNLQELKKDALKIEAVVISHNHWDHVYGLPGVMSARGMSASAGERPTVYVPLSTRDAILQQNPRAAVVAVDSPTEIMPGAWLIGPLKLEYRGMPFAEQALVLEHGDGLVVLVGCSHPGIVDIVKRVKELFESKKILFVGGGFHLRSLPRDEISRISSTLRQHGIEQIAPTHCTGDVAIDLFRQEWGDKYYSLNLGDFFTF
jgi:7,8-dihydropterin-6-yl-methyl-4-(beta-D-ribofuranosyl)aminobenzene 5'-phosphate synthase